ncbi:flagellar biosynthesis repressor FlbT [Pelagibacterium sp. H642]|uniref:flagellar biosynthesis repressor FlbT n=1 Tax=Pelagibacterium sp. H642 TaxID=1881069 RepID=UPI00281584E8|nr:flagellar biosynthesis repressor FlbT [Pelagibacterium sp. H642]WMT92602.1 flagellar biosynthesis repressor FlbT [Pelagibacterium sp. H642]
MEAILPLKINLKDGESVYFGASKVTAVHNGGYTILIIDGESMPVLKESEMVSLDDADTPKKRLYYHMQQHYLERSGEHLRIAEDLARGLSRNDLEIFNAARAAFTEARQFKALRLLRDLAGV